MKKEVKQAIFTASKKAVESLGVDYMNKTSMFTKLNKKPKFIVGQVVYEKFQEGFFDNKPNVVIGTWKEPCIGGEWHYALRDNESTLKSESALVACPYRIVICHTLRVCPTNKLWRDLDIEVDRFAQEIADENLSSNLTRDSKNTDYRSFFYTHWLFKTKAFSDAVERDDIPEILNYKDDTMPMGSERTNSVPFYR